MHLCECGCGHPTPIARQTRTGLGHVAGQPTRYIPGHRGGTGPHGLLEADCGYATPCLLWQRARDGKGYGIGKRGGRRFLAHRVAWESAHGPVPDGAEVHHLCGSKSCVRVDHLTCESNHRKHMQRHAPKLTMDIARAIRASVEPGPVLADRYGVSRSEISLIRTGKHWRE